MTREFSCCLETEPARRAGATPRAFLSCRRRPPPVPSDAAGSRATEQTAPRPLPSRARPRAREHSRRGGWPCRSRLYRQGSCAGFSRWCGAWGVYLVPVRAVV